MLGSNTRMCIRESIWSITELSFNWNLTSMLLQVLIQERSRCSFAVQTTNPAANIQGFASFLAKLNSTGSALVYSTYLGMASSSPALAVDSSDNAYIVGDTDGTDFPTTPGVYAKRICDHCGFGRKREHLLHNGWFGSECSIRNPVPRRSNSGRSDRDDLGHCDRSRD